MHNLVKNTIKATIIELIVALFIIFAILLSVHFLLGAKIEMAVMLANKVSLDISSKAEKIDPVITEDNTLKNYPEYGTQYAMIEIPKINIILPVYFGDTLEVLKNGVGHSSGSYFPGEGGSIVYMGHNSVNVFRRFSELQKGNEIKITTTYGEYTYVIYDTQLINETEIDKLPIQKEKEILMVYTCYPFNNIGYATQRYVVYAELKG